MDKLLNWYERALSFLGQDGGWKEDAELLMQDKSKAVSALCSLRVHYTLRKKENDVTEFTTSFTELSELVDLLQDDTDYRYWCCWLKFFISLSRRQWMQLWDDVDAVLQQM
jgi:hypothetical protein